MPSSPEFLGLGGRRKIGLLLVTAASVFALDQLSKIWVRANSPQVELLPGFLDLVRVENYGSAFGLLANETFLLVVAGVATFFVVLLFLRCLAGTIDLGTTLSLALILGGAAGNLTDRIRFGYVTDFVSIHLLELFHWPVFNVADACITVGVFSLVFFLHRSGAFRKA